MTRYTCTTSPNPGGSSIQPGFAAVLDSLASVRFAVALVILIAIVCAVGTVLPQGAEVAAYVQKYPAAGRRMEVFAMLGLTRVFSAWWFIGLLGLLAASVAACSARRFAALRRGAGFARRRALGSLLAHFSILLILMGGVIRGVWGEKGYLELKTGQTGEQFRVETGSLTLPFGLHLAKFEVETYGQTASRADAQAPVGSQKPEAGCEHLLVQWPARKLVASLPIKLDQEQTLSPPGEPATSENTFRIKIVKFVPDFIVDPTNRVVGTRSEESRNPAILVAVVGPSFSNDRWVFANFPDFKVHTADTQADGASPLRLIYERHTAADVPAPAGGPIKSFKSKVKVVENGEVTLTRTIEVNRPFSYKGYTFYQSGYNPQDLNWTSFQVVRDPGVPVVYTGFVLLLAGLFIVFYLNPWMEARRSRT